MLFCKLSNKISLKNKLLKYIQSFDYQLREKVLDAVIYAFSTLNEIIEEKNLNQFE